MAQPQKLYHMGIKGNPSRTNLARANQNRDWRIYFEFAQILIARARELYQSESPFSVELDSTVYALDATTIDLCLSYSHGLRSEKQRKLLNSIQCLVLKDQFQRSLRSQKDLSMTLISWTNSRWSLVLSCSWIEAISISIDFTIFIKDSAILLSEPRKT